MSDNRGSGLVSVLLCVALLTILGSAVIFGSYVNAQMIMTNSKTQKAFYDETESDADTKFAQVQRFVVDAVTFAYEEVLSTVGKVEADVQDGPALTLAERFAKHFVTELLGNLVDIAENEIPGGYLGLIEWTDEAHTAFRFKDGLLFEAAAVDYSNILTNFTITVPAFAPRKSGTTGHLKDFALIADKGLYGPGGFSVQGGNIYAGEIGEPGDGISGKANLGSDGYSIYVADDLNLGSGAEVTLYGKYYGFGGSATDATKSSAINVHDAGVKLDMQSLSALTLAGYSFVWGTKNFEGTDSGGVPMATSLSVFDDQKAYLVPSEYVMSDDGDGNLTNLGNPASTEGGDPAFIIKYPDGISAPDGSEVEKRYTPGYVYFLYKFGTIQKRNDAFKKYFEENPDAITAYLKSYFGAGLDLTLPATIHTRGLIWSKNGDEPKLSFNENASVGSGWLYDVEGIPSQGTSAWDYYVIDKDNETPGVQAGDFTAKNADGVVLAKSVPDNTKITAADEKAIIIVCDGDVEVENVAYTGLIIASGKVTLKNGSTVTRPADETLKAAFEAEVEGGGHVYDYLRYYLYGKDGDSVSGGDLSALVRYTNWSKNEDRPKNETQP
jgi:hypothetical protein